MTIKDIAIIRLASQQLAATKFKTAQEHAGWMGAIQAQDYAMSKWALGIRLPNSSDERIETAINKGEILRTHVMRPTWHLVSAENIYWMLELTAPRILPILNSRNKNLELSEAIYQKSNKLIEKALANEKQLSREELMVFLQKAKIVTDDIRASHLMMRAELEGIVCSGEVLNKTQTYALLSNRIPKTKALTKEKALAKLAYIYFTSHFPATVQDFIWWSGLSVKDGKAALEMIQKDLISEKISSETYWFTNSFSLPQKVDPSVYLLPAFDEYIISYKDRSACLSTENLRKALTNNGIFKPVILVNGQAAGIWKRTLKNDKVVIETEFFKPLPKSILPLFEKTTVDYGKFLNKKIEIK